MLVWLCLSDKSLKVLLSECHSDQWIKATVTMAMQSHVNKILDLTGRPEDRTRTQRGNRTIRLSQQGPMTPDLPREDNSTSTWVDGGRCELPVLLPSSQSEVPICTQVWTAWLWSEKWSSGKARLKFVEGKAKQPEGWNWFGKRKEDTKDTKPLSCKCRPTYLPHNAVRWHWTS